jgi:tRNA A-37 threonylcarbamoyl transferase component Bud32
VLDEVEVQKGFTQLGKGLQFMHESAKLVHGNLTPEAVIINAKVRLPPPFLFDEALTAKTTSRATGNSLASDSLSTFSRLREYRRAGRSPSTSRTSR